MKASRSCMSGDTEILLPNGKTKKLSQIRPNDKVMAWNNRNMFVTDTVLDVWKTSAPALITINTTRASVLCSENHKFACMSEASSMNNEKPRYRQAQHLKSKTFVLCHANNKLGYTYSHIHHERYDGEEEIELYDMEAENHHNYIAGGIGGFVVHNSQQEKIKKQKPQHSINESDAVKVSVPVKEDSNPLINWNLKRALLLEGNVKEPAIELLVSEYIKFGDEKDTIIIEEFTDRYDIKDRTWDNWLVDWPILSEAHELVKRKLLIKREKRATWREYDAAFVSKSLHNYSKRWDGNNKYWNDLNKLKAEMEAV